MPTEPTTIILTACAILRARLALKLAEYKDRYLYLAPEINFHGHLKLTILGDLLANGRVEIETYHHRFCRYDYFSPRTLRCAFLLVDCYNGGAGTVYGGTGLPELSPEELARLKATPKKSATSRPDNRPDPSFTEALAWLEHVRTSS